MTYMFILKCALKLVLKNILYYDARSEKHQTLHMFRASTCPSLGGQIVLSLHLVSSLSLNGCTVCRMRADCSSIASHQMLFVLFFSFVYILVYLLFKILPLLIQILFREIKYFVIGE